MGDKNSTSSNSNAGAGDRSNNATKKATKAVKKAVSFSQTKHPTEGIVDTYTFKDGKKNKMYGGQVSKATNDYLVSIGEAKKTGGGGYMLTSKGWKIKYGSYKAGGPQEGSAMGSCGAGVMSQVPISEKMFEQQKKIKAIALGGMSLMVGPILGSPLRMMAGKELTKEYGDYQKSFKANLNTTFDVSSLTNEGVANTGMGEVNTVMNTSNNKKKSKTTKDTTKYFSGTGTDESTNKRTFLI